MAFRRMLVSARRIGVPRKTERSDVLWGERLADLFKDKYTPKCQRGLNTEINCIVFEGLYNCKIIQMIDNLCKMCVL